MKETVNKILDEIEIPLMGRYLVINNALAYLTGNAERYKEEILKRDCPEELVSLIDFTSMLILHMLAKDAATNTKTSDVITLFNEILDEYEETFKNAN